MKVKLLYVVLSFIIISCKQSDIASQSLESKILSSKTILFEQQIDGNMISRPVIIETSSDIDNLLLICYQLINEISKETDPSKN